ncbi:hypothetical protein MJO28_008244, partial [Puccinia striiformis f. sp. tritici]
MSGVTVPPEVWAQMQQLLAAFAPSASTNSTVTTKAPAPLTPSTAPSIIGSEPLPSPAPLSDSLPPTTPSNWLTQSVSLSELPAVEDIASLSFPDESVEDHLSNGVPGSLHVENNNDFPHPSEAVTATGKELVQSILTLIIDINGYDYTTGEESPSDSSYNIDQESHHSDGVHLALEDVISHNFDEAESTHGENVERSSSDEDADPSPDDEGAVTAED